MSKADVLANLVSTGGILADGAITPAKISALHTDGGTMNGAITFANTQTWPTFNQSTTGNAATANKWTTARTLSLAGDATGNVSLDGSADATLTVAVADDSHNHTSSSGNFSVGGNLSVTGNLTINGTTTTVNSTVTTVDDPVITLGGDTAPSSDDSKDRGIEFRWHNGSAAKTGFFGFDDSTGYMMFIPDATNTSEVFSGTLGDIQATNFRGALFGNANTSTTLATARTINGVSFDGSANITVADSTKLPLAGGTMTGAISFVAGQTWPTFNQSTTGASARISVPDTRAVNDQPQNKTGYSITADFKENTAVSSPPITSSGLYSHIITVAGWDTSGGSGGWPSQLSVGDGIAVRQATNASTWGAWRTVLHSNNFSNYALPLSGGSLTGSLNLTGNSTSIRQNSTSSWSGDAPNGVGKLEYHSNRWYINAGADSTEIANFRRGATSVATISNAGVYSGNIAGSAATLNSKPSSAFHQRVHYGTQNGNSGYYKIKILSQTSWMLSFTIRMYQGYQSYDIRVSGYNYGGNYWYSPDASLIDSTTTSIEVRFGYDGAYDLWVAVPAGAYTGLDIVDVVNGYTQIDGNYADQFQVTNQTTLTGTVQTTVTTYRPLKYNENAVSASTAARATRANGNFYIDDNYGNGIVGVYSSYRYQGVFAMGDAYKLPADGTTTGSLYGMAWSHPNAGGIAGNLSDHGLLIINNGGFRCAISNSIVASGNITAYSDERLKTNWRDMPDNYVSRLAKVKVGIYDRIDTENGTQVGVSAQSFQELLPQAITTAKDDMQTLSVNYGGAALASAVELAKDNCELRARIERLEALIHTMIHKD